MILILPLKIPQKKAQQQQQQEKKNENNNIQLNNDMRAHALAQAHTLLMGF